MYDNRANRAVSEVIGVVLMVSITVLLAATAASMFLGFQTELGDSGPTLAMSHDFQIEDGSHVLEVSHTGGDTVDPANVRVTLRNAECVGSSLRSTRFTPRGLGSTDSQLSASSMLVVSDHTVCHSGGDLDLSRATVSVVWMSSDGGTSETLWQWRGPRA
jgi:flagellin-like protein